jgi:hypothetical protein
MEAAFASGDFAGARESAVWLTARRGQAYAELQCGQCLQALNIVDANLAHLRDAEALAKANDPAGAKKALATFDRRWPIERLPAQLRKRRDAVAVSN